MTRSIHPFPQEKTLESLKYHDGIPSTLRTNHQWIAALRGTLGPVEQQDAIAKLSNYQFVIVIRYLSRRQGHFVWLSNLSHDELAPLAQDIQQVCLERLAKNDWALLDQFEGRGSFTGWAAQIALNTARSELRRAHWHRSRPLADVMHWSAEEQSEPTKVIARQELILAINRCLAELSDTYREVIERCLINGEQASDVAKDLKRTVQAIYNILNRARRQLIHLLTERQIRPDDLAAV